MSTAIYKRSDKCRQKSPISNGKYSFDYVTLSLVKDQEISSKLATNIFGSETSETRDKDKNAWRKEFTEKLEFAVLNKKIQERLKNTARAQLDWLTPCFRTLNAQQTKADTRRRCFCESIGPKFCEVCRRKVQKDLSNRVPRIICDFRNPENDLSLLERAEYFVTPEPKFSRHLKQASHFYQQEGYESSHGDKTSNEGQCLSIENPTFQAGSRASSFSSLTSSKDGELSNDVNVPFSRKNTPNTSPVVLELPLLNSPDSSHDIPNDQSMRTLVPQLPEIRSDQNSLSDTLHHVLPDIPEPIPESDITSDTQMFHITHQLRSIHELKADASSPNNTSNQHMPPTTPKQPSSNFSDSQNEIPTVNNERDSSNTTVSDKTEVLKSENNDIKCITCDNNLILPKLPHPVEPVLLDLKYINFSIYDYDCSLDK